jgi:hypothetical protein
MAPPFFIALIKNIAHRRLGNKGAKLIEMVTFRKYDTIISIDFFLPGRYNKTGREWYDVDRRMERFVFIGLPAVPLGSL